MARATRMLAYVRPAALAALLAAAAPVPAAPCAGFIDVDSTNPFCSSLEWVKNRQITLGCAIPGSYCPADPVIRLSMAAFMNRLGRALSPDVLYHEANGSSLNLDSAPATVCTTAPVVIAGYPRQANVAAAFTASASAIQAIVDLRLVQSTDAGMTWTPITMHATTSSGTSNWFNGGTWKTGLELAEGTTYQFGLAAVRSTSAPSTGQLLAWNCQLKAVLESRTGTVSPY